MDWGNTFPNKLRERKNMNKTKYWVVALSDEDWFVVDECSFHLVDKKTLEEITETGYIEFPERIPTLEEIAKWKTEFIYSMDGEEVSKLLPTSDSKASFYETKLKSY